METPNSLICVIPIDGPAGAGKDTVGPIVARKLNWKPFDSGSLYRAATKICLDAGINPADAKSAADCVFQNLYRIAVESDGIRLDGKPVTRELVKTPEIDAAVYFVSKIPSVRRTLVPLQRNLARCNCGTVACGRDMGSVVFPDAPLKIYLTASLDERARRRHREYLSQGKSLEAVRDEIDKRDQEDMTREDSPLVCPPDAVTIESDGKDPETIADFIVGLWRVRMTEMLKRGG